MQGGIQQVFERFLTSNEALAVILAAIASTAGWLFLRAIRARIAWGVSHGHAFVLANPPNGNLLAYTKEIWIQNTGREVADDIEVIFAVAPPHFDLWPLRNHSVIATAGQPYILKIDNLNPREYVTISLFTTGQPPPDVYGVRFRGGQTRQVPMGPMQIYSRSTVLILQGLILFGAFSLIYFAIRALIH